MRARRRQARSRQRGSSARVLLASGHLANEDWRTAAQFRKKGDIISSGSSNNSGGRVSVVLLSAAASGRTLLPLAAAVVAAARTRPRAHQRARALRCCASSLGPQCVREEPKHPNQCYVGRQAAAAVGGRGRREEAPLGWGLCWPGGRNEGKGGKSTDGGEEPGALAKERSPPRR